MRHRATSLLRQLHGAYTKDKADRAAKTGVGVGVGVVAGSGVVDPAQSLPPMTNAQGDMLEAELDSGKLDDRVEHSAIRTGEVLRVHGIYMKERREFEIRVGSEGHMELWDGKAHKRWE